MAKKSFIILRLGLAVVFIWIGIAIFKDPLIWGGFLSPWAEKLLPFALRDVMLIVGVFDMSVGVFFLIPGFVRLASALGFLHLVGVLIVSNVTDVTIRDIGLAAMSLAVFIESRYR